MAKSQSTSPKSRVIRQICAKTAPTFRRYFGEIGRAAPSPTTAARLLDEAEASISAIFKAEFTAAGLPHTTPDAPLPGAHWMYQPIVSKRNFLHGRLPVSCQLAYFDDNHEVGIGGVYFPIEDIMVLAECGQGAAGEQLGRLRVAGRTELAHSLLLLPWNTEDTAKLQLAEKAAKNDIHTRKTGHTLFDIIDVAAGRADSVVATRLNKLEAALGDLILKESGAFCTTLQGKPITPESDTLVGANPKLHGPLLKILN